MCSHFLRVLERAAVRQVGGDTCCSERMIADRRGDTNCYRPPADHAPGIRLCHRLVGQRRGGMSSASAKQSPLAVLGNAGGIDIGPQRLGKRMVARHGVMFSPFLVQPDFPPGALGPEILDTHLQRRADAGEGIGEGGDQRPITQIAHGVGWDGVDQRAPFLAVEHRRLARFDHVLRAAHRRGRIVGQHVADDQPIEQHPHRGELLLHVWRRMGLLARLYICADINRPDRAERAPPCFAPGEELAAGAGVGAAGIRVANVGGEEVDIAPGGRLAGGGDQRRDHGGGVGRRCERPGLGGVEHGRELVGGRGHCDFVAGISRMIKDVIMRETGLALFAYMALIS